MIITKSGRCATCNKWVKISKEFKGTADMFQPKATLKLNEEVTEKIRLWRDDDMYCEEHDNA